MVVEVISMMDRRAQKEKFKICIMGWWIKAKQPDAQKRYLYPITPVFRQVDPSKVLFPEVKHSRLQQKSIISTGLASIFQE